MRNLNKKDIERLWSSGINCRQFSLVSAMIAKSATIEAAQMRMVANLEHGKPLEEQYWYRDTLVDFKNFCDAYSEDCYDEMVEEFTNFVYSGLGREKRQNYKV